MNTKNESEKTNDNRDARPASSGAEPFDAEAAPPQEAADFRDNSERGYGWGV